MNNNNNKASPNKGANGNSTDPKKNDGFNVAMNGFEIRDPDAEYTICVGNPGVGKSTILNGQVGQPAFKSGVS
jgi:ribosome biogenesis GTPase A